MTFETHDQAEEAKKAYAQSRATQLWAGLDMFYNERAYDQRGWYATL